MTEDEAISKIVNKKINHEPNRATMNERILTTLGEFLHDNGFKDLAAEIWREE
mgnify:CR=1 FL=1